MDLGLSGRVAWVTGGSGGIGSAVVRALAAEGALVGVGYHEHRESAQLVVEAIGARAMAVPHDMAEPASAGRAAKLLLDTWGHLDILVTCAWQSVGWPNPDREDIAISPPEHWRQELGLNVEGAADAVRATLGPMKHGGWGRIVLISSGAAEDGQPGLEAYAAAKASLHAFNRSLAVGLGRAGILCNVVMAGFVETERNRNFIPRLAFEQRASLTPTGRLATVEDIASAVVFLASDANRSMTGAALRVTGGL